MKSEVISQKNYALEEAFGIEVVVKVVVDTSVLEGRVKKLLQDRTHLDQLNQARAREKELLNKISVLEGENWKSGKSKQKSANLKKEFQIASRGLTSLMWFEKAWALWTDGEFSDPGKAVEYLTEAIRLKPNDEASYNNRGIAYNGLGQYQRAIRDYNETIRMKPNDARAYNNRGKAYNNLGQHQNAIRDYDEAIRLMPDYAIYYNNRGQSYSDLGQHRKAIRDFDEAIRLNPDYVSAYNRRGGAYNNIGLYQKAIKDFDEVIRLKPEEAAPYYNRAISYMLSGNDSEGCRSFIRACELGICKGYNEARRENLCQ